MERPNLPNKIIVHHSADGRTTPQFDIVNESHRVRFGFVSGLGFYIGYHYFVEHDGEVRQARKENEEGAHAKGQNTSSIGICLAGNFNEAVPSEKQKESLCKLIEEVLGRWLIRENAIYPHRAFADTSCYGSMLGDDWARETYRQFKKKSILKLIKSALEKLAKLYEQLIAKISK